MTIEGEWIDAAQCLPTRNGDYLAVVRHHGGRQIKGGGSVPPHLAYRVVTVDDDCEGFVWLGGGGVQYPIVQYWYTTPMPALPPLKTGMRPEFDGSGWALRFAKPMRREFP